MAITRISGILTVVRQVSQTIHILIAVCFFFSSYGMIYGKANDITISADISNYEFITNQSCVVQTGGIAGVFETYPIEGHFHLSVDFNKAETYFEFVDANLMKPTGFLPTENLGELFNMLELTGTVVNNSAIFFTGKTSDGMDNDILIIGFLSDDLIYLYGKIIPPECCDFFYYTIDALAMKKYSGGTGEPNNPYKIASTEDLISLGEIPEDYDKNFIMTNDIDLDPNLPGRKVFNIAVIAPDTNDAHWDFQGIPFSGVFDGNGHAVSNLTITGKSYLGLFGQVGPQGQVKGLGVEKVNITGSYTSIGGLVSYNHGNIATSYSTGTVTGYNRVGGLVGYNHGDIFTSYSTCTTSAVSSGNQGVGGLVGVIAGSIATCYSSGDVSGQRKVGGLVGWSYLSEITNSYSTGKVSGDQDAGGLVGFIDLDGDIATGCFWDMETSGQSTSAGGGTGLTTPEMQNINTYLSEGWDFVGETINGPNDIWKIWNEYDYPHLTWEPGPNTPLVFVDINDPNFYGQMSRYEVTNDQYCDFLNAALASGDITINEFKVEGANGLNIGKDYVGESYYQLNGLGWTGAGATSGSAARIHYNEGEFSIDSDFGNHPVTYVSWYGAMAFANYFGYYLPTEDQWQAVADYDGTYIYGCGETINPNIANYRDSIHPDGTLSVGIFGRYGYDMSDMAGNVWEWTSSGSESSRIFRGGSWSSYDSDCDISIRGEGIPYANYYDIGFRVCR